MIVLREIACGLLDSRSLSSRLASPEATADLVGPPIEAGKLRLVLSGRLQTGSIAQIWEQAILALGADAAEVEVDASAVEYCDGAGAAMIGDLCTRTEGRGARFKLHSFPKQFQPILDLVSAPVPSARAPEPPLGFFGSVGQRATDVLHDVSQLVYYVGKLSVVSLQALLHPGSVRWKDAFRAAQSAGVNSLPVVALVSGLLGLIIAFQSIIVLQQFGGETLLPLMVAKSMLRELGPLMTAVVLTARSGSAFAAEIGTMRVNEEVDALDTMGLDPVQFLVTPRLLAALVMTPLLTVFANIAGLLGGAVIWVAALGRPFGVYVKSSLDSVTNGDLLGGLLKACVFGMLVAGVGCIRGLQTRGGAIAVGESATRAVVAGIVLIAVSDSFFTFLFYSLGV